MINDKFMKHGDAAYPCSASLFFGLSRGPVEEPVSGILRPDR